jgi:acyl carrier protein
MYGEFQSLSFPKKGSEIKIKAEIKAKANKAKIDEKDSSIQKFCKEFEIDSIKLLTNLDFFRGHSSKEIPSQEIEKLKTMAGRSDDLKKENEKLALIIRNLPENNEYNLTFEELKYFGF